ncbi:MAG: GatB/YqeY domain protein [Parcubacteria group bacterium GW2011_GWF2_44_8b]|nr:MAG: GatB/YqeY domain protein [Parcubacteria group bacterium GW2011_GWC1_43_30]KKT78870.1 MAG: GatB/YqeY domain protein [Parcubacteria group bacterium GW2011_GWF2_44_8b]
MSLHTDIKIQMTDAMKARDVVRTNVLRGLMASFTNEAVAKKRKPDEELSDEEVLVVIGRAVKQRKDSIEQFEKGGRADLAGVEKSELAILETYLPTQMSRDEIIMYVKDKLANPTTLEATRGNKNQFIGFVMKELKGRADGALVKEVTFSIQHLRNTSRGVW